jgi:hypothetical protein
VTAPIGHLLSALFKKQAKTRHHDSYTRRRYRKFCNADSENSNAVPNDHNEFPCFGLIDGGPSYVSSMIEGSSLCQPETRAHSIPDHVQGFRCIFGGLPGIHTHLWKSLLPGLAQMWFRIGHYMSTWPFLLLKLIQTSVSPEEKRNIAQKLLSSNSCCLSSAGGFAARIKVFVSGLV